MTPGEFKYQLDLQKRLSSCSNVRAVVDTIQELELFIYPYLPGDLLRLSEKKSLSKDMRRNILRMALNGLADMHDKSIIHNGKFVIIFITDCPGRPFLLTFGTFYRHQTKQYHGGLPGAC